MLLIIILIFSNLFCFNNNLFQVVINYEKTGFINKEGKLIFVVPEKYYNPDLTQEEELMIIREDKGSSIKYGYLNLDGSVFLEPQFDSVTKFIDGVAVVKLKNTYYILKKDKSKIKLPQYSVIDEFSEGLAPAEHKNKKNCRKNGAFTYCDIDYIDKDGNVKITVNAAFARAFKNGLARIQYTKEDYNYINHNGEFVWPKKN